MTWSPLVSNRAWERFTYPSHYPELNDPRSIPRRPSLIKPERRRTEMLDHRDKELERYLDLDRIQAGGGSRAVTIVVATPDSYDPGSADFVTTGTDDQDTIQEAIDAIPVQSVLGIKVGTVVLREGVYNVTGSLTGILGNLIKFRGEYGSVILFTENSYTFATGGRWEGLNFFAGTGTAITCLSQASIFDCFLSGAVGSSPVISFPTELESSFVQSITQTSAAIAGGTFSLNGSHIVNSTLDAPQIAIDGTTDEGAYRLLGTTVIGRVLSHPHSFQADSCTFMFKTSETPTGPLLELDDSFAGVTFLLTPGVRSCGFYDTTYSYPFIHYTWTGGSPALEFQITGNNFGNLIDSVTVILDGAEYVFFNNNVVTSPVSLIPATYNLVELVNGARDNKITHNDFGFPAAFITVASAVALDATTTANLVCFNTFEGAAGVYITDLGVGNTITCPGGV